MALELKTTESIKSQVDAFFFRSLFVENWDRVREDVRNGRITPDSVIVEIKKLEPLLEDDPRQHQHWTLQQILRLCLLQQNSKPLVLNTTCPTCGSRKSDPYYGGRGFGAMCLHCAEEAEQRGYLGSRGSCEYLHPTYNPISHSWGLVYYWDHGHQNEALMFWLADFYPTRIAALDAIQPIKYYHDWVSVVSRSMVTDHLSFSNLIPLSVAMDQKLPLTPDQFRNFLRSRIEDDMREEKRLVAWAVEQAMSQHERKECD